MFVGAEDCAERLPASFGTTIGDLWAFCGLSVAFVSQIFVPLYIIGVLNTQRFSGFALNIGGFGE